MNMPNRKKFIIKMSVAMLVLFFAVAGKTEAQTAVGTCNFQSQYRVTGPLLDSNPRCGPVYMANGSCMIPYWHYFLVSGSHNPGICDTSSFRNFRFYAEASYPYIADSVLRPLGSSDPSVFTCSSSDGSGSGVDCGYSFELFNELITGGIDDSQYSSGGFAVKSETGSTGNSFVQLTSGLFADGVTRDPEVRQPTHIGTYNLQVRTDVSFDVKCNGVWKTIGFGTVPMVRTGTAVSGTGEQNKFGDAPTNYIQNISPSNAYTTWDGASIGCSDKSICISNGTPCPTDYTKIKPTGQCTGTITPSSGTVPVSVSWSATGVSDGGGAKTYSWTFDGGSSPASAAGSSVTTNYSSAGSKTATLTITPAVGLPSDPITCLITAVAPVAPVIPTLVGQCSKVTTTNTPALGTTVRWQASGVSGGTTPYTYSWSGTDQATPSTTNPYDKTYSTVGVKTPTLAITSADGQTINPVCPGVTVSPSLNVVVVGAGTINSMTNFNTANETADGSIANCSNSGGSACAHQYSPNVAAGLRASIPTNNTVSWSGCDSLPNGAGGSGCSVNMNGDKTITVTFTASVTAIDVTLTCPASVTYSTGAGTGPALSWTTTGSPTSCIASGGWTGSKTKNATNGPETQTGITADTTYSITCAKSGTASVSKSCTVQVGPSQPVISVSTGWCGGHTYISLPTPSQGATSYVLNRWGGSGWSPIKTFSPATSFTSPYFVDNKLSLNANYTYQIQATGSNGLSVYSDYTLPSSSGKSSDSCAVNLLVK